MKIKAKVFGTLSQQFPDYSPEQGLELEIQEGTTAGDLLAYLKIPDPEGGIVILNGRPLKKEDELPPGGWVNVFQTMYGG
jgi:sulfur carrier protein ThiS